MDTEMEFVKGSDGKIEKAMRGDEEEHYELKKVKQEHFSSFSPSSSNLLRRNFSSRCHSLIRRK